MALTSTQFDEKIRQERESLRKTYGKSYVSNERVPKEKADEILSPEKVLSQKKKSESTNKAIAKYEFEKKYGSIKKLTGRVANISKRFEKSKDNGQGIRRIAEQMTRQQPEHLKRYSFSRKVKPSYASKSYGGAVDGASAPLNNQDKSAIKRWFDAMKQKHLNDQAVKSSQLSENTRQILQGTWEVQNMAKNQNAEMQRRLAERRAVASATSLLATPNIFAESEFNNINKWIVEREHDILRAPNTFAELPNNKITITGRPNILQTRETGNNLKLWGDPQKPEQKPVNNRLNFWKA